MQKDEDHWAGILLTEENQKLNFGIFINELNCNSSCPSLFVFILNFFFFFFATTPYDDVCTDLSFIFQWNEVTRLFRAGMPLRKHRQNLRPYSCCFTASSAVDWLHQLLCNNSNFGPDVTRQQTVQLLKKFLKNHVIEDVKGRWGTEDLEDNSVLYRWAGFWSCKNSFKLSQEIIVNNRHIIDCSHPLFSRFPSTSPLKKIPCPPAAAASNSIKKRPSFRDKESFFKFKSLTKNGKEAEVRKTTLKNLIY